MKVGIIVNFFVFLSVLNSVAKGQAQSSNKDLANFLLNRMLDTRMKVNNFKCKVEYLDYRPNDARQRQEAQIKKAGIPKKHLERLINSRKQHNEYRYNIQQIAFDNQDRARVHRISWISDADGKLIEETSNRILTWDGKNAIEFGKPPGNVTNVTPYATLSNKQPFETTKRIRQPWQQFGGDFCPRFAKAIAEGTETNVNREQDGVYRVEIIHENDKKEIAIVDPSQGYSLTSQEGYLRGQLRQRYTATYTELSPGVWFPTEGEDIRFTLDDPPLLQFKSTMKVTGVTINDPNFYEGLFRIDFPKGTKVRDDISGLRYVIEDPTSINSYPDGIKLDGITSVAGFGEEALNPLKDKPLPDMKQFGVADNPNEIKDKMILVCFFNMDQRPSRNCMRQLSAKAQELKTKGVFVVVVHASKVDDNKLRLWLQKYQISFPVGMIKANIEKTRIAWGVNSLPRLILTDKKHTVIAEGFAINELDKKIKNIDEK
jgi:hypothetical protein